MNATRLTIASILLVSLYVGCTPTKQDHQTETKSSSWSLVPQATLEGFHVPECALYDETTGLVYISNIESKPGEYWKDDGKGYISILGPNLRIKTPRWVESTPAMVLHGPKGMCRLGQYLYVADNTRLVRFSVATGKNARIMASGFKQANDLATDGKSVWLSDTVAGKIYRISPEGEQVEIATLPGANGLTFFGTRLFAVSWDLHDLFELDPLGVKKPVAFGLAEHFTNLDGIEVLEDGTFLVSDFTGNKVCAVRPDRSSVETLVEIATPADIGLNRKDRLLYVPQFMKDEVVVFRLQK